MKIIRGEKGFKRRGIKFFVDIFFFPSRINIKRLSLINKIRMENGETKEMLRYVRNMCIFWIDEYEYRQISNI